jgi:hypothetical protein
MGCALPLPEKRGLKREDLPWRRVKRAVDSAYNLVSQPFIDVNRRAFFSLIVVDKGRVMYYCSNNRLKF